MLLKTDVKSQRARAPNLTNVTTAELLSAMAEKVSDKAFVDLKKEMSRNKAKPRSLNMDNIIFYPQTLGKYA